MGLIFAYIVDPDLSYSSNVLLKLFFVLGGTSDAPFSYSEL